MASLRAVKGMNDVLPEEVGRWQHVEAEYARTMALHGFREVRTPLLEPTPLFVGAIGEATDVVEKEMYSFVYRDEPLTLRPEGTASAARAYVQHGIHNREPVSRWYYQGAMFRAERPQRGRYRQFHQLGAEIFGDPGPGCDAEMIDMLLAFLAAIGVGGARVHLNTLGGPGARERYRTALLDHLTPRKETLSADSQRRLGTNPLRILDSKSPADHAALEGAPTLHSFIDAADREHFDAVRRYLDVLKTPYEFDARLVRGLDYYTRTLFEIKAADDVLGAGNTVVGGGRYDEMIAGLGGPAVPAIGFAVGLERLLLASATPAARGIVDVLIAPIGEGAIAPALVLARDLRGKRVASEVDARGSSLKSLLRRANIVGARFALILGDTELADGSVVIKDLAAHVQETVPRDRAVAIVADRVAAQAVST